MSKNTSPLFTITGDVSSDGSTAMAPTLTTAAADYTGQSSNNAVVFTSDTTNGSRIVGLHFEAIGSNIQSVARIYFNNSSTQATAANNSLAGKITLPATSQSNTSAEPIADYIFPNGYIALPAGWKVLCGLATTVAAGWTVTPIQGGKF